MHLLTYIQIERSNINKSILVYKLTFPRSPNKPAYKFGHSAFICYKRVSLPIPTPAGRDVATSTYSPNQTRECVCLTSVVAKVLP